jgi:hypothetical protein
MLVVLFYCFVPNNASNKFVLFFKIFFEMCYFINFYDIILKIYDF